MTAVVAVETLLLVVLVVLVAALLRSHAEILRRLGPGELPVPDAAPRRASRSADPAGAAAPAVHGSSPDGDPVALAFDTATHPTLLAFLTTGCTTCLEFWRHLGEPHLPPEVGLVIVTQGSDRERPARVRGLAPAAVPVVMSSQAWEQYAIPAAPYFVLVDGEIRGEGAASTWHALASLVRDALEDSGPGTPSGGLDEVFAAAGIGPDDPSLYPAGRPGGG